MKMKDKWKANLVNLTASTHFLAKRRATIFP